MASTLQTMRSGGTQHPEEIINFLASRLVKGVGGVFDKDDNNSFLVEEETVPAMSVKVNEGYAFLRKSGDDMVYPVRLYDGDASVTISANASGNDRIDAIVLYIDLGASANAEVTNVAKFIAIEGTPAGSPSAPSDGDIEAEIGANNPYLRIADVDVANGAVSILDADITDQRSEVLFISNGTPTADDDVVNKAYVDAQGQWIDWSPTFTNIVIGNATVVAKYTKIGKKCRLKMEVTIGSTTSFGAFIIFTLPLTAVALAVDANEEIIGCATLIDGGTVYKGVVLLNSTTQALIRASVVAGSYITESGNISGTVPFTWATGDQFTLYGEYEIA